MKKSKVKNHQNQMSQKLTEVASGLKVVHLPGDFFVMRQLGLENSPEFNLEEFKEMYEAIKNTCISINESPKKFDEWANDVYELKNRIKRYSLSVDIGGEIDQYEFETSLINDEFTIECKDVISKLINRNYPNKTFTMDRVDNEKGLIGLHVIINENGDV